MENAEPPPDGGSAVFGMSDSAQPKWRRYQRLIERLMLVLVLGSLAYVLALWASRSAVFAIDRIEVVGANRITVQQLEQVKATLRGNFFSLNLYQAKRAFEKLPWVKHAQVQRLWPRHVRVTLVEYQPVARWLGGGLIDGQGVKFVAAFDGSLPVLASSYGADAPELLLLMRQINQRLALLAGALEVRELTKSERGSMAVKLSDGSQWVLGRDKVLERLDRWVAVYPEFRERFISYLPLVHVDLRYPTGVAVRFK